MRVDAETVASSWESAHGEYQEGFPILWNQPQAT